MDYVWTYDSPLGVLTLASDGTALTGLWFAGQLHFASTLDPDHRLSRRPEFDPAMRWLDVYFSGREPDFTPPLHLRGSAFRQAVWAQLLQIPYGTTRTYGAIAGCLAREAGRSRLSAQAVGGAVGHNPVSLIVPCHRVVGCGGAMVGYAGGLWRKEWLLALEQRQVSLP